LAISSRELAGALREPVDGELEPVFSPLAEGRYARGLETIYEGYLVHYGRPRLFEPADDDTALVLGDYLYAQGLARIAGLGETSAVGDLAELISLCAQIRADGREGDGAAWAATAAVLAWRSATAATRDRSSSSHARPRATRQSTVRLQSTPAGSVKVAAVASLAVTFLTLLAAALEEERPSAADEGRKIITAMLLVGVVFIAVIALGQLSKWAGHRREERRRRQQAY
jgi:hypothetical protein